MHGAIECAFIGRVAQQPELKTSAAGKPWAHVGVAVGRDDEVQWPIGTPKHDYRWAECAAIDQFLRTVTGAAGV
jgi:hypothetical protein